MLGIVVAVVLAWLVGIPACAYLVAKRLVHRDEAVTMVALDGSLERLDAPGPRSSWRRDTPVSL